MDGGGSITLNYISVRDLYTIPLWDPDAFWGPLSHPGSYRLLTPRMIEIVQEAPYPWLERVSLYRLLNVIIEDFNCEPGSENQIIEVIKERYPRSNKTVRKNLRRLEGLGLIESVREGGIKKNATIYTVVIQ